MNSFKFKLASIALALGSVSTLALAQANYFSENNKTVKQVGAQSDYFYVTFNEGFGTSCAYRLAYIAAEHKGVFAILLSAKLNGKTLSRVDYDQPGGSGTSCSIKLVEIAN